MSDTKFKQKANQYLSKPACQRGGEHEWETGYTFWNVFTCSFYPSTFGRNHRPDRRCKHCDAVSWL